MPISCSVEFSNKYGDIDMMDLENDAVIELGYGNLTMGDLEGDLDLELAYGKGFAGMLHDVDAEVRYSKFRADMVKDFEGETKYSVITLNNANDVEVESKYDNYKLGKIGEFQNAGKYDNFEIESCSKIAIETKYTDLKVTDLTESLVAEINYGGVKVRNLMKGFEKVVIDSDYAVVNLGVQSGAGYELEVGAKYVDTKLPGAIAAKEQKDGSEKYIQASVPGKGNGKILLEMNYGKLEIK